MACGRELVIIKRKTKPGLNPSFSGIWPVAIISITKSSKQAFVLILLLVEYGLWRAAQRRV